MDDDIERRIAELEEARADAKAKSRFYGGLWPAVLRRLDAQLEKLKADAQRKKRKVGPGSTSGAAAVSLDDTLVSRHLGKEPVNEGVGKAGWRAPAPVDLVDLVDLPDEFVKVQKSLFGDNPTMRGEQGIKNAYLFGQITQFSADVDPWMQETIGRFVPEDLPDELVKLQKSLFGDNLTLRGKQGRENADLLARMILFPADVDPSWMEEPLEDQMLGAIQQNLIVFQHMWHMHRFSLVQEEAFKLLQYEVRALKQRTQELTQESATIHEALWKAEAEKKAALGALEAAERALKEVEEKWKLLEASLISEKEEKGKVVYEKNSLKEEVSRLKTIGDDPVAFKRMYGKSKVLVDVVDDQLVKALADLHFFNRSKGITVDFSVLFSGNIEFDKLFPVRAASAATGVYLLAEPDPLDEKDFDGEGKEGVLGGDGDGYGVSPLAVESVQQIPMSIERHQEELEEHAVSVLASLFKKP